MEKLNQHEKFEGHVRSAVSWNFSKPKVPSMLDEGFERWASPLVVECKRNRELLVRLIDVVAVLAEGCRSLRGHTE